MTTAFRVLPVLFELAKIQPFGPFESDIAQLMGLYHHQGYEVIEMARREGQIRGEMSEMEVAVALLKRGCRVSDTIGHAHPYDLIADIEGKLLKIQVKTAKHRGRQKYDIVLPNPEKYTENNVDMFAGYAREEDAVFFVPYSEMSGRRASVTFTPPEQMGSDANRERANLARDYTFDAALTRMCSD